LQDLVQIGSTPKRSRCASTKALGT
jgi:hypothetical protein